MVQPSIRHLAAIVSIDLHGYSRLTEQDEVGTHRALMACMRTKLEPVVRDLGGHIVKLTGDGALLHFPNAPQAVDAMMRFQQDVKAAEAEFPESRRLVFRVGIHLGPTIVDHGDVFGHGVNLAVRLQEAAEPGAIYLSEAILNRLDQSLARTFDRHSRIRLKNISEPVEVFGWRTDRRPAERCPRRAGLLVAAALLTNVVLPTAALNTNGSGEHDHDADVAAAVDLTDERQGWLAPYHGLRNAPLDQVIKTTMAPAERSLENRREIAEDAYLQALALYGRHTPEAFAQAIELLDDALTLQPDDGATHALLAALYWGGQQNRWQIGQGMTRVGMLNRTRAHLSGAPAESPLASMVRSEMLTADGRHDRALAEAERAVQLAPAQAAGHHAMGSALLFAGRAAEAEEPIRAAIRLDPAASRYLFSLALAQFSMSRFGAAERTLAWAIAQNDADDWPHLLMAATQGHLGLGASARQAIGRFDRMSLERRGWFASQIPYVHSWPFKDEKDRERLHLGMVLAGIPEISR